MKLLMKMKPAAVMGMALLVASPGYAGQEFAIGDSGWTGSIGFQLQAFVVDLDTTTPGGNVQSQRIASGFDPSKLTIGVTAPEMNGVTVSGTYQLVQAINGAKSSGDATFNGANGGQFQVRVAELAVSGGFGKVTAGRSWAIFGSSSLIHDTGSLPGLGRHGGGLTDAGGGTAGRIDYGYYYPDFHAGVQYISNDFNGISFRIGAFDPINGADPAGGVVANQDRSEDLRLEGELVYKGGNLDLWVSFIDSSTVGADEQSGIDLGGEIRFGSAAITLAFSDGDGILCCQPNLEEMQQWYVEADISLGDVTIGASFGENDRSVSATGADISEGELFMLFWHYNLTPTLTLIAEFNNESIDNAAGVETLDADTIAFGANWQF